MSVPRVPDELLKADLPDWIKIVWITIRKVQGNNEWAFGSRAHYAAICGKSESNISHATTALISTGWMVKEGRNKRQCIIPQSVQYTLSDATNSVQGTLSTPPESVEGTPQSVQCTPQSVEGTLSHNKEESLSLIQTLNPIAAEFDPVKEYQEAFGIKLTPYQLDLIQQKVKDVETFRDNLDYWRGNNYLGRSVAKFLDRYAKQLALRSAAVLGEVRRDGNLPEGAAQRNLSRVPKGARHGKKRTGELSWQEYLDETGWTDDDLDRLGVARSGTGDGHDQGDSVGDGLHRGNPEIRLLDRSRGGERSGGGNGG